MSEITITSYRVQTGGRRRVCCYREAGHCLARRCFSLGAVAEARFRKCSLVAALLEGGAGDLHQRGRLLDGCQRLGIAVRPKAEWVVWFPSKKDRDAMSKLTWRRAAALALSHKGGRPSPLWQTLCSTEVRSMVTKSMRCAGRPMFATCRYLEVGCFSGLPGWPTSGPEPFPRT